MAVLWTSSSCFFPSRFSSLLRVVLSLRGIPYCRYSSYFLVLGILVVLPYGLYLVRPYVVTELGSLHRHVRNRLHRAVGRVSRSRLSTSSRPLLPCTFLLSATESTCSSMAWGSTVFGVAWLVNSFEARKGVLWLLESCQQIRTGWCCVVSTRLKPRGLAKPPRVSPLHVSSLGFFPAHIKGRSGSKSPAEFGVRSFKPVTGQETGCSLDHRLGGRAPAGALREETPQDL